MPVTNPWAVLAVVTAVQASMSMVSFLWGPLAPFLVAEFGLSATQVGAVSSSFYLVASALAIPAGLVVDRLGSRVPMIASQWLTVLPLLALSLIPQFAWVVICVAVCGLAYSPINQASARAVVYWFPPHRLGLVMGIRQTGNMAGGAFAAAVLPAGAVHHDWRTGLYIIGGIVVATALLTGLTYREPPADTAPRPTEHDAESAWGKVKRLLRNPVVLFLLMLSPVLGYGQIGMLSFFVLFVSDGLGHSPALAGAGLTIGMLAAGTGRIGWGWVGDRFFPGSRSFCLCLVMTIATASAIALALVSPATSLPWLFTVAAVYGASAMGWHGLLVVALTEAAGRESAATALGMMINAAWLGWIFGPVLFGLLVDSGGYQMAWISVVVTSAFCAVSFLVVGWRALHRTG
ncbi:MAG: MFS transporter [Pseudomonadota bacterium]|nr:MFS transporter [Pseudomonadota bacterium]